MINSICKWLCKIGIHKWSDTWHVTNGGKIPMWEWMVDFWVGYVECERCKRRKRKSEYVHREPLYTWEKKRIW